MFVPNKFPIARFATMRAMKEFGYFVASYLVHEQG